MGIVSDGLMKLRPVTFKYREEYDPSGLQQSGLIAEEVAEVAPDLVRYDVSGQPEGVRYHLLNVMLLNEMQKQHRTIVQQQEKIGKLQIRLARLEALVGQSVPR